MSRVTNSSRAARTGSAQGVTGLLNKPQVRGGLLTSSRSFDSRTQVGMRFKGSKEKDKEEVKCTNSVAGTTTSATAEMTTGMFRKSRDISVATASSRHSMAAQSQVAATPVKRTRPVLTSFTAEPDNPFINDSHVVDESPFAKRMRGESTGPRRRLGLGDGTSVVFDSARRKREGSENQIDDSPVRCNRYSVVMESPTKSRTLGVGHGNYGGGGGGLFSNKPSRMFSTTIRPSMAAPVAAPAPVNVSATPKRRTQPTLTKEQYPREDNPFYNGTDDAVMDTSPTKRV